MAGAPRHHRPRRRAAEPAPRTAREVDAAPVAPGAETSEPEPQQDLRHMAVQGVKWNFLATSASLVVRLLFTFVLARLIGPASFGIVSLATVYVMFVVLVLDQGFGPAIVQRRDLRPVDVGSVMWLNVATGFVLAGVTLVAAPWAATFFSTPELTTVLRVLSVTLVIRGFTLVPQALVQRELRFQQLAIMQTVAVVAGGVAGIAAGMLGAQYWALVVQTVVNDVIFLVAIVILARPPSWAISPASLKSMFGFSSRLMGSNFMVYIGNNADTILIGRFVDATELALYSLAYRLLKMPVQLVGSVVAQVSLPVFAQMQNDDDRTRAWFLVATRAVAFVTFPAFLLLAVAADPVVHVLFGSEWSGAVAPLRAMAIAGLPMVARTLLNPLATSRALTGLVLGWSTTIVAAQFAGFIVGLWLGGMVGVAVSIPVVQFLTWLPQVWHTLDRTVAMRWRTYFGALVGPTFGSLVAAGAWWLAYRPFWPADSTHHPLVPVVLTLLLALGVYLAVLRIGWRSTFVETREIGAQMLRRR